MPAISSVPISQKTRVLMHAVDRASFLPLAVRRYAHEDRPLPIGYGATCSAPGIVAVMTELLTLAEGMHVLEIGTGCGYHAAVTAAALGASGKLTTLEIVPELAAMARKAINADNVTIVDADGSSGFVQHALYDRIYLTAAVDETYTPEVLLQQLQHDGILVYPVDEGMGGPLRVIQKKCGTITDYRTVIFVPLKREH